MVVVEEVEIPLNLMNCAMKIIVWNATKKELDVSHNPPQPGNLEG